MTRETNKRHKPAVQEYRPFQSPLNEKLDSLHVLNVEQRIDLLATKISQKSEKDSKDSALSSISAAVELFISAIFPIVVENDIQKIVDILKPKYPCICDIGWIAIKYFIVIHLFGITYLLVRLISSLIKRLTSNRDMKKKEKDRDALIGVLKQNVICPLLMGLSSEEESLQYPSYKDLKLYQAVGYYATAMRDIAKYNLVEYPDAQRMPNEEFLNSIDVSYLLSLLKHSLMSLDRIKKAGCDDPRIPQICDQMKTKINYLSSAQKK